jgi:hypothetical protein
MNMRGLTVARGALSDYRAAPEDGAQDKKDHATRIDCPTLALWGEDFELVGQMWDVQGSGERGRQTYELSQFSNAVIYRTKSSATRLTRRCWIF